MGIFAALAAARLIRRASSSKKWAEASLCALGESEFFVIDESVASTDRSLHVEAVSLDGGWLEFGGESPRLARNDSSRLAMRCLALCHSATETAGGEFTGASPEEKSCLAFAEQNGVAFRGLRGRTRLIREGEPAKSKGSEPEESATELARFEHTPENPRLVVVVRYSGEIWAFARGNPSTIAQIVEDPPLKAATRPGAKLVALAARRIDAAEWRSMKAASDRRGVEQKFRFLGVVALRGRGDPAASAAFRRLRDSGAKLFFVGAGEETSALRSAKDLGILPSDFDLHPSKTYRASGAELESTFSSGSISDFQKSISLGSGGVVYLSSPDQQELLLSLLRSAFPCSSTSFISGRADLAPLLGPSADAWVSLGSQNQNPSFLAAKNFEKLDETFAAAEKANRRQAKFFELALFVGPLVSLPQLYMAFCNWFSPRSVFDGVAFQLFPLAFGVLPLVFVAAGDKPKKTSKEDPQPPDDSERNESQGYSPLRRPTSPPQPSHSHVETPQLLNASTPPRLGPSIIRHCSRWWISLMSSVITSLFIFLISLALIDWSPSSRGTFFGFSSFGQMIFLTTISVYNFRVLALSSSWSFLLLCFTLGSIATFFVFWLIVNFQFSQNLFESLSQLIEEPQLYLSLVALLPLFGTEILLLKLADSVTGKGVEKGGSEGDFGEGGPSEMATRLE